VEHILTRPATLAAALEAYQALWHGQVAMILGRPMEDADVAPLKAEQHRLLCLLAGVPESDTNPAAHFCAAPPWHVDDWRLKDNEVLCPNCVPGAGRFAGGWHDLESVLVGMPLVHEAIRRLIAKQGE
jgi:hypothetical protein